jgi:adenylate cyclase
MLEIERKFRLSVAPGPEILGDGVAIRQAYILAGETELRIREKGNEHYLTAKSADMLVRGEWESEIPEWVFEALWREAKQNSIDKNRYSVPYDDHVLEVDVYSGRLAGLVIRMRVRV